MSFITRAVHGFRGFDPATGAISTPIYQTSTYRHTSLEDIGKYDYSRTINPTREELENTIAMLEGGVAGFAFSSGLSAELSVFSMLSQGDHVVIGDDTYGGTYRMSEELFTRFGVEFTPVDTGDEAAVRAAIRPNTKMIYLETPTNPMMKVTDLAMIGRISKECGAIFVVDNTFLTPYFQRPIEFGADIVIHSGTKFLSGHHDTMSGLVVTANEELAEKIHYMIKTEGAGLAPFDSWLVLRGIKTLPLRMDRHNENCMKVAEFLKQHPRVEKVIHTGLPEHPGHEIMLKQTSGFGGTLSFVVDSVETVKRVLANVEMIMFAESLGGTDTLITYPLTQTHASIPENLREKLGITDRLLRLSVGLEDVNDIIADLKKALD